VLPRTHGSIVLNGRQSKVIVTDYAWGHSGALYSTASIYFAGSIGRRDVLFLYGDADQSAEVAVKLTGTGKQTSNSRITFSADSSYTTISFASGNLGLTLVYESETQLILFSDPVTAATFWAPVISGGTDPDFDAYWQLGSNLTILVGGPYLVRNAILTGSTLAMNGDLNASVPLTIIAPDGITDITWNGAPVNVNAKGNSTLLTGQLTYNASAMGITVPKLDGWKFADSLPEIYSNLSDSDWVIANHTTTNLPPMNYGDGRILYGVFNSSFFAF
jgi:Beta-galactosidase, domain 2/Beta-galactosidase, domain 3